MTGLAPFYSFEKRQFKILAAEDDYATAVELKQIFAEKNCIIDIFETGEEVLAALDKDDYDMVWLNVGIVYGMGGFEVAKIIRARKDPIARIPIYLFTSDSYKECEKKAKELEINGYIGKPFSMYLCKEFLAYMRAKL